ncbi:hypothetical protein CYMTET_14462, partial [Cymbomonas tetramitiformis]
VLKLELERRDQRERRDRELLALTWQPDVPGWLASKAEYDGDYTVEGAKEGWRIMSNHVSRALRVFKQSHNRSAHGMPAVRLVVSTAGNSLEAMHVAGYVSPEGDTLKIKDDAVFGYI